ncbi:MAG: hypothetical protein EBS84_02275 [Proteobacteria bacterium]|nr:hypothetical protein [Verrucomicrobiota bacterium]NBU07836.1 hypothetical protein [Pseudomonadota bacterium]
MNVLFDGCVPRPLRGFLVSHIVKTAPELGWGALKNGDLLRVAEEQFDLLLTADQNLRYQQNLKGRRIAVLVLPTNDWTVLRKHTERIAAAVAEMTPGSFRELDFT